MQNIAVPITGMTGETVMCWGEGCYGDIAKDHVTRFRLRRTISLDCRGGGQTGATIST